MELRANCEICEKEYDSKYLTSFKGYKQLCKDCIAEQLKQLLEMNTKPKEDKVVTLEVMEQSITDSIGFAVKDQFWNAENTQLDLVEGSVFERYQKISQRLTHWQSILFESQQSIAADYIRMQSLKAELTNEERKALKITYTDYNPGELNPSNVKPVTARKPRESADTKAARTIAESLYKRQILLGDTIQKKLFIEHPEYYTNGIIRAEHAEELNKLFKQQGAMTLDEAVKKSQDMIRDTKQSGYDEMGKGNN